MGVKKRVRRTTNADRLDEIADRISENHEETVQRLTKLETQLEAMSKLPERVSILERARWKVAGAAAAFSAAFTALATIWKLKH